MSISLRQLRDLLINKEGYTIPPKYRNLKDLKTLINNMNDVRSEPLITCTEDEPNFNISGSRCTNHIHYPYEYEHISLGNLRDVGDPLLDCTCHIVQESICYCVGRDQEPPCDFYNQCDCHNRTALEDCPNVCGCLIAGGGCGCQTVIPGCQCHTVTQCSCNVLSGCQCNCVNTHYCYLFENPISQ